MGGLSPEHVPERNSAVSRDSHSLVSLSLFFIPLILLSLLFTLIFFPSPFHFFSFPLSVFPFLPSSPSSVLTLRGQGATGSTWSGVRPFPLILLRGLPWLFLTLA